MLRKMRLNIHDYKINVVRRTSVSHLWKAIFKQRLCFYTKNNQIFQQKINTVPFHNILKCP